MNWTTLKAALDSRREPDLVAGFVCMALNALVYLPLEAFAEALQDALGADLVARDGGGGAWQPHMLTVRFGQDRIIAFEGTRDWQGWALHATEAGWSGWPYGDGRVYGSFLLLFEAIKPAYYEVARTPGTNYVTGHSLGGALACLAARFGEFLILQTKVVHTFGTPRCVDQGWIRGYRSPTYSCNHPLDPIPWGPVDAWSALTHPSISLAFTHAFVPVGVPWALPAWAGQGEGIRGMDVITSLAASAMSWRTSIHQTYQYLLFMHDAMTDAQRATVLPVYQLLQQLGLLAPWPA